MDHLDSRKKQVLNIDKPFILNVKIKSRHSNQTIYKSFIDYNFINCKIRFRDGTVLANQEQSDIVLIY